MWLEDTVTVALGVPASLVCPIAFFQPGCLRALAVFDSCWVSGALHIVWYTVGAQQWIAKEKNGW